MGSLSYHGVWLFASLYDPESFVDWSFTFQLGSFTPSRLKDRGQTESGPSSRLGEGLDGGIIT